jgi:hypothetical protein
MVSMIFTPDYDWLQRKEIGSGFLIFAPKFGQSRGMTSLVDALDELLNGLCGELAIDADALRKIEQEGDEGLALRDDLGQKKDVGIGGGSAASVELFEQRIMHEGADALPFSGGERGDELVLGLGDGGGDVARARFWRQN